MKGKARLVLALLAMLVMMAAAFGIGAYKGFYAEKVQVELALSSLSDLMATRIEMGQNLLVVARRHLETKDSLLAQVQQDLAALDDYDSLDAMDQANQNLSLHSKELLAKLEGLQSVKNDQRDLGYVTGLLPRGFELSAKWADASSYNEAARAFNQRLTGTIGGRLARVLGVEQAELFAGGQVP